MFSAVGREIINLSGEWLLKFDPENSGKGDGWFKKKPKDACRDSLKVVVPRIWQEYNPRFSGGVGWYFRDLAIQEKFEGKILHLKFWAVDYLAEVWVNGQYAGSHHGGYTPFELDITKLVKPGKENYFTVRVLDPPRGKPVQRMGTNCPGWEEPFNDRIENYTLLELPQGMQMWVEGFNFGGIWQPVELIVCDRVYISDVFIMPNIKDGSVEVKTEIQSMNTEETEVEFSATVAPWKNSVSVAGRKERKIRLHSGINIVDVFVAINNPHFWSPEDPYLYEFNVHLSKSGKKSDSVSGRFGLREFTVKNGFFFLNGKRIFIKGGHNQSTFPKTLIHPPTKEFAYNDIKLAKEAGLNFSRIIQSPAHQWTLDAADELGLLIQEEPPISFMRDSSRMKETAIREVAELVKRDRNRPSVIIWNMINENAPAIRYVEDMCLAARKLDPTRLITENNGGRSRYYLPYSNEGFSYVSEHLYGLGAPITENDYRYCSKRAEPGQLYFITEFAFAALPNLDEVLDFYEKEPRDFNAELEDYRGWKLLSELTHKHFRESGLKDIFEDLSNYIQATQKLQANAIRLRLDALRSNPSVAGYNYCCLFESNAIELDGLVNFTRNGVKKAYGVLKEINDPLLLVVHCDPMNICSGQETRLKVTLVNEERIKGRRRLVVEILSQDGKSIYEEARMIEAKPWVSVIFDKKMKVEGGTGKYKVRASLLHGERILTQREDQLMIIHDRDLIYPKEPIGIFDPDARLEEFLNRRKIDFMKFGFEVKKPVVIVVAGFSELWRKPTEFMNFIEIFDLVKRGCTVLFLEVPQQRGVLPPGLYAGGYTFLSPLALGYSAYPYGKWIGNEPGEGRQARVGPYHGLGSASPGVAIPKHPIFKDLPSRCLMDREYGNVAPNYLVKTAAYPIEDLSSLVQIMGYGSGKIIFSTFILLPYLETDAIAKKILCNLLTHAKKGLSPGLEGRLQKDAVSINFRKQQYKQIMEKFFPPDARDISRQSDEGTLFVL